MLTENQKALEALRAKMGKLNERAQAIQAVADAESRDLTDAELGEMSTVMGDFENVENRIAARERLENQTAKLVGEPQAQAESNRLVNPVANGGAIQVPDGARIIDPSNPNKGGFVDVGHYAQVVAASSRKGAPVDPRLIVGASATTYMREGVGVDGGFMIPPDFRGGLVEKAVSESFIWNATDKQRTRSNSYIFTYNKYEPWNPSGVTMKWGAEGSQHTQQKIQLANSHVDLHKASVFMPVSEEQLEDAGSLNSIIDGHASEVIAEGLDNVALLGNGVNQPEGMQYSPAKITVTRSGASAFTYADATAMLSRLAPRYRNRAFWIAHPTTETKFLNMEFPGDSSPIIGSRGYEGEVMQTLLGLPIRYSESTEELGTEGDIFLCAPSAYLTVSKNSGVQSFMDMSLYFDYDEVAFKFRVRVGGQSWLRAPIARRTGTHTTSSIVTLSTV